MKLYFVRHGETDWNVKKKIQGKTDIPLNENGVRQAKKLAGQLAADKVAVGRIYHSPQLRAAQTAQIAGERLSAECVPLEGLIEMNLGVWEGSNWRVIERENSEEYRKWRDNRRYVKIPEGECYDDVVRRTLAALEYVIKQEKEDVLIVTHSAIIMALRCYIAGAPFDSDMPRRFKTRNAEVIMIERFKILEAAERFREEEKTL